MFSVPLSRAGARAILPSLSKLFGYIKIRLFSRHPRSSTTTTVMVVSSREQAAVRGVIVAVGFSVDILSYIVVSADLRRHKLQN